MALHVAEATLKNPEPDHLKGRNPLASDEPPKYQLSGRGSLVDSVENDVRKLLVEFPRMLATVIAERIG